MSEEPAWPQACDPAGASVSTQPPEPHRAGEKQGQGDQTEPPSLGSRRSHSRRKVCVEKGRREGQAARAQAQSKAPPAARGAGGRRPEPTRHWLPPWRPSGRVRGVCAGPCTAPLVPLHSAPCTSPLSFGVSVGVCLNPEDRELAAGGEVGAPSSEGPDQGQDTAKNGSRGF